MKLGKLALVGALTFGGFTAVEMIKPTSQAAAASGYGASVNLTQNNWYVGTQNYVDIKIKNDNKDFEVQLRMQPQILKNGVWVNVNNPLTSWFVPGEYVGMSIAIGSLDYNGVGITEKGTYRLKVDTLKTTSTTDVWLGTFYTDMFYLK
ncbi:MULTISPECIES: DUF5065 family protein [Bacillus]|uniref:DUF5065 family protein n=1 Tax=Bacillus TaxID=1386 RepID=UPI00032E3552|nr:MULTISPECIES: DUF5065 family protein [Bacillus]EOP17947.1 hypothetical protein IIS_04936 [Bacillus cereus VD131]OFC99065.1 hypothetical protein BTGOE5_26020 [Bacillus thuringiensis]MBJ8044073.1 DUF5065 family protein [Bacillus cereus group sp. N17]MBJ8068075.1 DUF5065 family protein [Bacillus cereus group sp. N15]MCS3600738.1 hypothetical protein [Bacillus sp. JUb91]